MPLSERDAGFIAVGAGFALLLLFMAWHETDHMQPRYETAKNPNLSLVVSHLDTGDHYFHPDSCVPGQGVIFTPHRYPSANGVNLTAVIHRGHEPLFQSKPTDSDWRVNAPAEQAW